MSNSQSNAPSFFYENDVSGHLFSRNLIITDVKSVDISDYTQQLSEGGMLNQHKCSELIHLQSVRRINYEHHTSSLSILCPDNKKDKITHLVFSSPDERDRFIRTLLPVLENNGFYIKTRRLSALQSLFTPIVTGFPLGLILLLLYIASVQPEALDTDGRILRAKTRIFMWIVETIGSTPLMVIGILWAGFILFWSVKRFSYPPTESTIEKA